MSNKKPTQRSNAAQRGIRGAQAHERMQQEGIKKLPPTVAAPLEPSAAVMAHLRKVTNEDDLEAAGKSLSPFLAKKYLFRLMQAYCEKQKDALNLYLPLPSAEKFHASTARTRLGRGSNQSSKTVTSAVEFCRLARGMDPYNKRKKGKLKMLVVGKDANHNAQVIYDKIFFPGLFDILIDEDTGLWRAVRPNPEDPTEIDPADLARKDEWQPAPPLIPPSEIESFSFESKKENIPKMCRLKNGTVILFHVSGGYPRNGIEVDVWWFDEEIENQKWLPETQARCLKRDGLGFWSFTPQAGTAQAYALHERVLAGDPDVDEFLFLLDENPYISKAAKLALYNSLKYDPDELAVRYYGEYAIAGRKVYPMFDPNFHGVASFSVPQDWMRFLVVDPGTTHPAIGFFGIPPGALKCHLFAELAPRNADAYKLAMAAKEIMGTDPYQFFLMDFKAGAQRAPGRQNTTADHYEEEFMKAGLFSYETGSGFFPASADTEGRELSLKRWMRRCEDGLPTWVYHREMCKQTEIQIKNRFYRKDAPNKRDTKGTYDLVDVVEYAAAFFDDGLWYKPPKVNKELDPNGQMWRQWQLLKKRFERQTGQSSGINLGPVTQRVS